MNLTQYPYAFGIYLLYCLPFFLLGLFLAFEEHEASPRPATPFRAQILLPLALIAFALIWVVPSDIREHGVGFKQQVRGEVGLEPRLGIRLDTDQNRALEATLQIIREHSSPQQAILAFPDSPEIYFLADRKNPTPAFYDFFNPSFSYLHYLEIAQTQGVRVIQINLKPEFSRPLTPSEIDAFRKVFPFQALTGHRLLLWRDPPQQ